MKQNYFELFGLPARFSLDERALDEAFRDVQGQVHPDRFANASSTEQRLALQWATHANEAYRSLKSPLARAKYLCELHGVDLETESNTSMPAAFLVTQMEWRESLDEARSNRDVGEIDALTSAVRSARAKALSAIASSLDAEQFQEAAGLVRQLLFIERFSAEIDDAAAMIEEG